MTHLTFALRSQTDRLSALRKLTLTTTILTYFLIVAGNVVRITDSGMGCPDWPLCYGQVIPIPRPHAVIEVFHRVFAGVVSALVVAIAVMNFRWKTSRALMRLSAISLGLLAIQIILGAVTVWSLLHTASVAAHLAAGMAFGGCLTTMTILAHTDEQGRREASRATGALRRSLALTAGAVYILLVTGGIVAGSGAALACGASYPLCNGSLLPNGGPLVFAQWLHRVMAAATLILALRAVARVRRAAQSHAAARPLLIPAYALIGGFVAQAAIGAFMVLAARPPVLATLHNAVAAFTWFSALSLAVLASRLPIDLPQPANVTPAGWRRIASDYLALTKPRVISLLLLTTLAAMFITPAGPPAWYLVLWTAIGGYLMAGGANAVNMAYDTDIDRVMGRTSLRPVPQGRVPARNAYIFGFALAALAFAILVLFINVLTAALALAGFVYYTVIYTRWLKRRTWHNIVIGGGAGAIPALVGWAAASGQLTWPALMLFAIVFYWTPPHFWALALMKKKDYARASVPMLPVVAGEQETIRQIFLYAIAMVVLSLVPVPLRVMGWPYLAGAVALGGIFLARAWQLRSTPSPAAAARLYKYSLLYLALLFVSMVIDRATTWS